MSCFINDLHKLIVAHNMKSIAISANIENSKLHIDTYERFYNEETKDLYIAHKPDYDELVEMFREECK